MHRWQIQCLSPQLQSAAASFCTIHMSSVTGLTNPAVTCVSQVDRWSQQGTSVTPLYEESGHSFFFLNPLFSKPGSGAKIMPQHSQKQNVWTGRSTEVLVAIMSTQGTWLERDLTIRWSFVKKKNTFSPSANLKRWDKWNWHIYLWSVG